MNMIRCKLFDLILDKNLWGKGLKSAIYTITSLKTKAIKFKIPEKLWQNFKPDLKKNNIFERTKKNWMKNPTIFLVDYAANRYCL